MICSCWLQTLSFWILFTFRKKNPNIPFVLIWSKNSISDDDEKNTNKIRHRSWIIQKTMTASRLSPCLADILELHTKQRTVTVRKSRLICYLSDAYVIKISKSLCTGNPTSTSSQLQTPLFNLLKLSVYNNVLINFSNVSFEKKGWLNEVSQESLLPDRKQAHELYIIRFFYQQSRAMVLNVGFRDPPDIHEA